MEFQGPAFKVRRVDRDKYEYRDAFTVFSGTKAQMTSLLETKQRAAEALQLSISNCVSVLAVDEFAMPTMQPTRVPPGASGLFPRPAVKEVVAAVEVVTPIKTKRVTNMTSYIESLKKKPKKKASRR